MATDKRKRAIRSLAAEHGVSYTTAMRMHDASTAPAGPASFSVAGERLSVDGPLLVSADPGGGAPMLGVSIAVTAAEEGAEVVILGGHEALLPYAHLMDEPAPGRIAGATADFASSQPRHPQDLIDYLNSEFARRMTAVVEHGVSGWRDLPQAVRIRERMDHPIFVVEALGAVEPALRKSALLGRMQMTCQRLRRRGRAAGLVSVSVYVGGRGRTLVNQVHRREFARAILGRIEDTDGVTASLVDTFVDSVNRCEYMEALPALATGQFLILNRDDGPEVRQLDAEPYLHLFSANPTD